MAAKQPGIYAKDQSKYVTLTNGNETLVSTTTIVSGSNKVVGSRAPDGSVYVTLTNGLGSTV